MIEKSEEEIRNVISLLENTGALDYTCVVATRQGDMPTMHYLAPYAGAAMADFYKFYGGHSFIVYDDFTTHNRNAAQIFREGLGLYTYGNWTGELLERAGQLNEKVGGGSHTAVCVANKVDDKVTVLFDYLPFFASHVDMLLNLSEKSFRRNITPPIALYPVPYGTPKYQKGFLRELANNVRLQLYQHLELERAYREQTDLGLHIDPDIQHVVNHIYKMEVLFSQQSTINVYELLLLLSAISNNVLQSIHVDKIGFLEDRLLHYFIENPQKHELIDRIWTHLQNLKDTDPATDELKNMLQNAFTQFLDDNHDLCSPPSNKEKEI